MKNKISIEEYKKLTAQQKKKSKYNSVRCSWKGVFRGREQTIKFQSKEELNRFCELIIYWGWNQIEDLQLQEPFELYSGIKYRADFTYYDKAEKKWIVEDVKGVRTEVYKNKKKMFLEKYPGIKFVEIN